MAVEDRKQERAFLRGDSNAPCCALQIGSQLIPINSITDISVAGTGVRLTQPLREGLRVRLHCNASSQELIIRGRVAWCRENQPMIRPDPAARADDGYRGGICFDNADLHKCSALYSLLQAHVELTQAC